MSLSQKPSLPSTETLIIGGGLAGLALADRLQAAGIDYQLIEASPRLGGRVLTASIDHDGLVGHFDLGPAWYWPGQDRIAALVRRLELKSFEQYSQGAISFEDGRGNVTRNRGFASMQGSLRLGGGMAGLTKGLARGLDPNRIHLSTPIAGLRDQGMIEALGPMGDCVVQARQVVLAIPPRLAQSLTFDPSPPPAALATMRQIPTWMAGHAKLIAVYDRPFWRDLGLSGDSISQYGPLAEIHDASDPSSGLAALFGFIGVPVAQRQGQEQALEQAALAQLTRIFGDAAQTPLLVLQQDWALAPATAHQSDHAAPNHHPAYGLPHSLSRLWQGRLHLGSTETAEQFGGFLEGALETANRVADELIR